MKTNKIIVGGALLCLAAGAAVQAASHERQLGTPGPADHLATAWTESLGTVVADPGFEGGTPNADWNEFSLNFGTPLCDEGSCGLGGGTGPNSGAWWAWFGGIGLPEEGSVSQMVDVPAGGSATLTFFLEMRRPATGDANDFLEVLIDGNAGVRGASVVTTRCAATWSATCSRSRSTSRAFSGQTVVARVPQRSSRVPAAT